MSQQKYTAIWQAANPHEREWIKEVMGPAISEHVVDGKHQVVLDNAILIDGFIYCHDAAYYEQFRGKNAFLMHLSDENYEGGFELYRNFRGVFRFYWSDIFNEKYIMKMPLGYSNSMAHIGHSIERATKRKYLWSFIGQAGKSSRPDVAKALSIVEPHFMFSTTEVPGMTIHNVVDGKPRRFPHAEFTQILFDSTFAPCPMGNANLECFRVYESLECGSIPIVEKRMTLDYFHQLLGDHPMPTVRSWRAARSLIHKLLRNPDDIDRLQEQCIAWWADFKLKHTERIAAFLKMRSKESEIGSAQTVSGIAKIPGWQTMELLRHHNTSALYRRVSLQVTRLMKQGKLREAYRAGVRIE